jgi:hypothetical protein
MHSENVMPSTHPDPVELSQQQAPNGPCHDTPPYSLHGTCSQNPRIDQDVVQPVADA